MSSRVRAGSATTTAERMASSPGRAWREVRGFGPILAATGDAACHGGHLVVTAHWLDRRIDQRLRHRHSGVGSR